MATVLVVDDQIDFCRLARQILGVSTQFLVLGESYSANEAMRLVEELKPDCVLIDVEMEGIGGLEASSLIRRQFPETQVVLMSVYDETGYGDLAARAGAIGFIPKRELSAESLNRILSQARRRPSVRSDTHRACRPQTLGERL